MKYKLLSIFTAAGLLLVGCAEVETPVESVSVIAIMEGDQTRTSVTDGGAFSWSAGDQIWLQTTSGSVLGTLSSGAGSARASFSTGAFIGDLTGKAVYPYNASHSISGDELSFVLPASYDLGSNLTNTNAAMFGVDVDGAIKFNHLGGVMRFVFKNAPVGTDKFRITLDKKISGVFTADLSEALPVIETSAAASESEKTVTLNFDALELVSDISLYIPLPVGTYTTLDLELWAGDESLWSYSNTVTNKISCKTLKLMPVVNMGTFVDGDIEGGDETLADAVNLSKEGTANCYIVSSSGLYKFTPTKGKSNESVGAVVYADVLWESFGTNRTPNMGDLIKNVKYVDGTIIFETPSTFKEGNAVIAAKDASDNILWSWHIWLTDEPQGQVYYNNAGTMMDRNLGATSATPGEVGALGLLYQWGRKDPFLGASSISYGVLAMSTIIWPSSVSSTLSTGTIEYATAHPTTFITYNNNNWDWYYTESPLADKNRWITSETSKSIYDPCPSGWRVPDGGNNGVWATALGSSSYFTDESLYDSTNKGMNFFGNLGSDATIWYPASGYRNYSDGILSHVGSRGEYWSGSYSDNSVSFNYYGGVDPTYGNYRAGGYPVRCVKEGSVSSDPEPDPLAVNLSDKGTANCYIVSAPGSYKFSATKGNSSESVGAVASVETLWESFGTDITPNVGGLVNNVCNADGSIFFKTRATFKEGNAVIAAKDSDGNILWSWHIWLTDEPQGQLYYNNAGTMMDRNLGATSTIPGDVGTLGLLYQWGRKDPFLGSSSISSAVLAKSTGTWPSTVSSDSSNGTIEYATAHPTTFITYNNNNGDWYYTGDSSTDNTRWTESEKTKSIYDPCPSGWRVPDGGSNGVWATALGSSSDFIDESLFDSTHEGINFLGYFGSDTIIWYPASSFRRGDIGSLYHASGHRYYWSASHYSSIADACALYFNYGGRIDPSNDSDRAYGYSVRCVRE